jgi:ferredoxin
MTVTITVETPDGECRELTAPEDAVLRDVLRDAGLSPHGRYATELNCGGRGLCATCGVRLAAPPTPDHWHDSLADQFGYPRLSCQIEVRDGMTVKLLEKRLWGHRE